ncbi:MAG TPA: restriction endonuclease [Allosphingosinicella sp.]
MRALIEMLTADGHSVSISSEGAFSDQVGPLEQLAEADVVAFLFTEMDANIAFLIGFASALKKFPIIFSIEDIADYGLNESFVWYRLSDTRRIDARRISVLINRHAALHRMSRPVDRREGRSISALAFQRESLFEHKVESWFVDQGGTVNKPPMSGGFDFAVTLREGATYLVEVKGSRRSPIGLDTARQLLSAVYEQNATAGILVSNSEFTSSTKVFCERSVPPIRLWRMEEMERWDLESITG